VASSAASLLLSDTVKLQERPKATTTKHASKDACGRVNDPGYGDNVVDGTMGNLQPTPIKPRRSYKTKTVHGDSSETKWQWVSKEMLA
jgi:hypothetical protein